MDTLELLNNLVLQLESENDGNEVQSMDDLEIQGQDMLVPQINDEQNLNNEEQTFSSSIIQKLQLELDKVKSELYKSKQCNYRLHEKLRELQRTYYLFSQQTERAYTSELTAVKQIFEEERNNWDLDRISLISSYEREIEYIRKSFQESIIEMQESQYQIQLERDYYMKMFFEIQDEFRELKEQKKETELELKAQIQLLDLDFKKKELEVEKKLSKEIFAERLNSRRRVTKALDELKL